MTVRDMLYGATSRICFNADDGSGGGGAQNDGGEQKDETPKWAKDLQGSMQQVGVGISELVNLAKRGFQPAAPAGDKEEEEEEEEEEVDGNQLEGLTRLQFMELMTKKIVGAVNKQVVKPLSTRMETIASSTQQRDMTAAVQETINEKDDKGQLVRPDFWQWKDEMVTLAQQHPTLTPKQLYKMARDEDPKKASTLDAQFKKKPNGDDGDGSGEPQKIKLSFGGLTPGRASGARKSENQKMTPQEAGNTAWEETVNALGGAPVFED